MRAVLQRVSESEVKIDGKTAGKIGKGLMILLCVMQGDSENEVSVLAEKISKLRIFEDENGKMNLSVKDVNGSALIISQFTLAAECRKGNRPDYFGAAFPDTAKKLYERFIVEMKAREIHSECGEFGADMKVSLINDGPVTIILDTELLKKSRA